MRPSITLTPAKTHSRNYDARRFKARGRRRFETDGVGFGLTSYPFLSPGTWSGLKVSRLKRDSDSGLPTGQRNEAKPGLLHSHLKFEEIANNY